MNFRVDLMQNFVKFQTVGLFDEHLLLIKAYFGVLTIVFSYVNI